MNFPFVFNLKPELLWLESRELDEKERHFEIYKWELRLAAHEKASDLWWATLDLRGNQDPRDFWRECIERNRIARAVSIKRGFVPKRNANGARLCLEPRDFDVLVAHDNSGLARIEGESNWRPFQGTQPKRVRKPLARVPTIWSPHFHLDFGRRAMASLAPQIENECLARLPSSASGLWEQGASARSIRLVVAAVALGFADDLHAPMTPLMFWNMALNRASKKILQPPPQKRWTLRGKRDLPAPVFSLPAQMQKSPEVALEVRIDVSSWRHTAHYQPRLPATFNWKGDACSVYVEFFPTFDSEHEQLEARLELRDWLGQFFPLADVETWLQ